ncbi:MAG: hypothetical protein AAGF83_22460 [Cyanobacteria bacterium P01_G01_bin.67]
MKQNIRLFREQNSPWSKFLDWNPQFFREIKGKLKTRNIVISAAISVIIQFVAVISLLGQLPDSDPEGIFGTQYSSYCLGNGLDSAACTKDMLGNWVINWQLLWLDLFIILSIISIFSVLVIGTYMLIADTVQEESRGTLNFIRLTPQSASSILLGKMLGVPILLFSGILLLLPLHLASGLNAHIPAALILGFYGVVVASCGFFYSLALLWSLTKLGFPGLKPWLGSGLLGVLLFVLTRLLFDGYVTLDNPAGWLFLFNPSLVLSYLIDATYLPNSKIDFLTVGDLSNMLFLGQALWKNATIGISTILFHFCLWTYWCWSIAQRRFLNPDRTLISKTQSYWLTGWFVAIALGFTLQSTRQSLLEEYFIFLQFCLGVWGLGLIAVLSPHRQALHDWSRYRHQVSNEGKVLWQELIFGENSPSTVAIAINLLIAIAYIVPSILLHLDQKRHHLLWGFILCAGSILLLAVVAQFILTSKTRKRGVWSIITVTSLIIVPPVCLGFAEVYPETTPLVWLFSFLPTVITEYATVPTLLMAVLGQWLAISVIGFQMTRKLRQAGASETKLLLDRHAVLTD